MPAAALPAAPLPFALPELRSAKAKSIKARCQGPGHFLTRQPGKGAMIIHAFCDDPPRKHDVAHYASPLLRLDNFIRKG
eukprot:6226940-Heterocapsa_arctica.AAC.1